MSTSMVPNEHQNPIFEFAARAQRYEREQSWDAAVAWYQRALTCLPRLFGAHAPIRSTAVRNPIDMPFTPKHAARLYAALGKCLMARERWADSLLANEAATALDPDNISARKCLHGLTNRIRPDSLAQASIRGSKARPESNRSERDLSSSLTLLMVTHCTRKLKKFRHMAPPSTRLVATTYGSLMDMFGPEILRCRRLMGYDFNRNGGFRDAQYGRSLERFAREHGFELSIYPGVGLFNILSRIVENISTPYLLFVEHDWLFRGGPVPIGSIIQWMNFDPHIHSVRFNKRTNRIDGNDFLLSVSSSQDPCALLRTSSYSNNPSILRTDKLKREWLPLCAQALQQVSDRLEGSAFGVEEALFRQLVHDIRAQGFETAHTHWGTYLFGRAGDPARVVHLGE